MKYAVVILFCFGLMKVSSAQSTFGYATMRVFDCNRAVGMGGGYIQSKILISYEDGSSEEVELLPFSDKNEVENMKRVTETLNKLRAKGYFLISQSTSGEQGSMVVDYSLLKQQ